MMRLICSMDCRSGERPVFNTQKTNPDFVNRSARVLTNLSTAFKRGFDPFYRWTHHRFMNFISHALDHSLCKCHKRTNFQIPLRMQHFFFFFLAQRSADRYLHDSRRSSHPRWRRLAGSWSSRWTSSTAWCWICVYLKEEKKKRTPVSNQKVPYGGSNQ